MVDANTMPPWWQAVPASSRIERLGLHRPVTGRSGQIDVSDWVQAAGRFRPCATVPGVGLRDRAAEALHDLPETAHKLAPIEVRRAVRHKLGVFYAWERGFDFHDTPSLAAGQVNGPPDFVGIGVQKAGTSWWFRLITDHPEVSTLDSCQNQHKPTRHQQGTPLLRTLWRAAIRTGGHCRVPPVVSAPVRNHHWRVDSGLSLLPMGAAAVGTSST